MKHVLIAVLLAGAAIWASVSAATVVQPSLEQAVKASYLFKFAPFVAWPTRAFDGPNSAFVICIAGQDPFGALIDDVVRGQKISGRSIAVRRIIANAAPSGCHMLFLGRSQPGGAPISEVNGQPVLTVTDKDNGITGGMIQFLMQDGRVRFQIDDGAARASGLSISSKLLGLAVAVER